MFALILAEAIEKHGHVYEPSKPEVIKNMAWVLMVCIVMDSADWIKKLLSK